MASVEDQLLKSLNELEEADLKTFWWHLRNDHDRVSKCDVEKADRLDTVDKMVACFGAEGAVKVTVKILRKMNQNELAEQLENSHKQGQAEGNIKTPAAVGAHSKEISDSLRLTPDLNTANKLLRLSEGNIVITFTGADQLYPDHPDRFEFHPQVLCRESVCGRSYWEIEWNGVGVWISVSYQSISRKGRGDECWFGANDQSWSLVCSPDSYEFRHNNIETVLPVKPITSSGYSSVGVYDDDDTDEDDGNIYRAGVYVDHSAGTLSFYSISGDSKSLIHTVQTTFTKPLYPGFGVYKGSVRLC